MTAATAQFFVEKDAYNEPALWVGTGPDDNRCQTVALKRELDAMHPMLWPTLLAALIAPVADVDLQADIRETYQLDGMAAAVRLHRQRTGSGIRESMTVVGQLIDDTADGAR